MTPLGWGWALYVWGYALAWFLVTDRVRLLAYRVFDPTAAPLLGKIPVDVTPPIAKRAYALYEQQGRWENHAVQDWLQAEREVRIDLICYERDSLAVRLRRRFDEGDAYFSALGKQWTDGTRQVFSRLPKLEW